MTPTPHQHSSFPSAPSHSNLRLARLRRPRNANPYDAAHQLQRTPVPATPEVDDEDPEDIVSDMDSDEDMREGDRNGREEREELVEGQEEEGVDQAGQEHYLEEGHGEEGGIEEAQTESEPPFDPSSLGLKEIGNLASWTVSSCKPGCGVEALRNDDTGLFWQSDGPQPHHLNIHFSRLVSIASIRIFLDFKDDESYTPTKITLLAGTAYHDLIPFSSLEFEKPRGWIDVPLQHVGGGKDGRTLRCFLVQVRIVENHQNGKDTHVRGLKVFARDERVRGDGGMGLGDGGELVSRRRQEERVREREDEELRALMRKPGQMGSPPRGERRWLVEPDWMGEPELR